MAKENLLLSADGAISLYKTDKEIMNNLDELIDEFYKWKQTSTFDETLFVKFLKTKYGEKSIEFVKVVDCNSKFNPQTGNIEVVIEEEYKETRWYNF